MGGPPNPDPQAPNPCPSQAPDLAAVAQNYIARPPKQGRAWPAEESWERGSEFRVMLRFYWGYIGGSIGVILGVILRFSWGYIGIVENKMETTI